MVLLYLKVKETHADYSMDGVKINVIWILKVL